MTEREEIARAIDAFACDTSFDPEGRAKAFKAADAILALGYARVPEGWQIVPKEPTGDMRLAMLSALIAQIIAQHEAVDNMSPELKAELEALMSNVGGTMTVDIPDSEVPRRYMRLGALTRNSNETDAVWRAGLSAAPNAGGK